jgi:hypothetical protein
VQGLRTRYNGKFDATILLDQLDHLQTPDPYWAFTFPATMTGAAICIFAVGLCLWRCCHQTKERLNDQALSTTDADASHASHCATTSHCSKSRTHSGTEEEQQQLSH